MYSSESLDDDALFDRVESQYELSCVRRGEGIDRVLVDRPVGPGQKHRGAGCKTRPYALKPACRDASAGEERREVATLLLTTVSTTNAAS